MFQNACTCSLVDGADLPSTSRRIRHSTSFHSQPSQDIPVRLPWQTHSRNNIKISTRRTTTVVDSTMISATDTHLRDLRQFLNTHISNVQTLYASLAQTSASGPHITTYSPPTLDFGIHPVIINSADSRKCRILNVCISNYCLITFLNSKATVESKKMEEVETEKYKALATQFTTILLFVSKYINTHSIISTHSILRPRSLEGP